eukprot:c37958_g1_i1 orf=145-978(+)
MSMAAAETAAAAGTRRAVIRSERFVQWQRELSSARRAPYGSRKRNEEGKINGIQIHQKESEDVNGRKELRGMEDEVGEDDDHCNGISKVKEKKHPQQQPEQVLDCKKLESEISSEYQKSVSLISPDARLCSAPQNQLAHQTHQQQEQPQGPQQPPQLAHPIKRRRRCAPNKDQESQPSQRYTDGDANAKMDLPNTNISKRSTRLLARTLQIEQPLPPPLKLPKLHVVLSRKEVQEDWLKMTGRRYTGKPRKSALIHLGLGLGTSLTCPSTIRYLNDP